MIDLGLAQQLKQSGLRWDPAPGDHFAIPKPDLSGQVFTLADMTIDVHRLPSGPVLAFNGTTEWALDSVPASEAVWLPAEHQLRGLLGRCFRQLGAASTVSAASTVNPASTVSAASTVTAASTVRSDRPEVPDEAITSYEVVVALPGVGVARFSAAVAEDAYALALLELLRLVMS